MTIKIITSLWMLFDLEQPIQCKFLKFTSNIFAELKFRGKISLLFPVTEIPRLTKFNERNIINIKLNHSIIYLKILKSELCIHENITYNILKEKGFCLFKKHGEEYK